MALTEICIQFYTTTAAEQGIHMCVRHTLAPWSIDLMENSKLTIRKANSYIHSEFRITLNAYVFENHPLVEISTQHNTHWWCCNNHFGINLIYILFDFSLTITITVHKNTHSSNIQSNMKWTEKDGKKIVNKQQKWNSVQRNDDDGDDDDKNIE